MANSRSPSPTRTLPLRSRHPLVVPHHVVQIEGICWRTTGDDAGIRRFDGELDNRQAVCPDTKSPPDRRGRYCERNCWIASSINRRPPGWASSYILLTEGVCDDPFRIAAVSHSNALPPHCQYQYPKRHRQLSGDPLSTQDKEVEGVTVPLRVRFDYGPARQDAKRAKASSTTPPIAARGHMSTKSLTKQRQSVPSSGPGLDETG